MLFIFPPPDLLAECKLDGQVREEHLLMGTSEFDEAFSRVAFGANAVEYPEFVQAMSMLGLHFPSVRATLPGAPLAIKIEPGSAVSRKQAFAAWQAIKVDYDGSVCSLCFSIASSLPGWEGRHECEREHGLCSVFNDAAGPSPIHVDDLRAGIEALSVFRRLQPAEAKVIAESALQVARRQHLDPAASQGLTAEQATAVVREAVLELH